MSGATTVELVSGSASFVLALAWAALARAAWWRVRARRGPVVFARLAALLTSTVAFIFLTSAGLSFVPDALHRRPPDALGILYVANEASCFVAVALLRHWVRFFAAGGGRASRAWLAFDYGSAAAMTLFAVAARLLGHGTEDDRLVAAYQVVMWAYLLTMLGLSMRQVAAFARGPRWSPGSMNVARRPDVVVLAVGVGCMLAIVVLHASGSWHAYRELLSVLPVVLGLALLVPFAVRYLGGLLVGVGTNLVTLGGAALVLYAAYALDRQLAEPALRPLVLLFGATGLVLVFNPLQRSVAAALDRVVLRRRRDRWLRLQAFLRELSPEAGAERCVAAAVAQIAEGMHLRGAAFLSRDGEATVAGNLALERVATLWPRGEAADALVSRASIQDDLAVLPRELREALVETDVVALLPVRGASRGWGHLLLATDLVGTSFFEDELQSIEAFADQLARVLDAADMLTRVVAAERSLAHAEKLAAIGELAARVAHEIRNPVTAARSLAQTLSRDPTSPDNAEVAEVILDELRRVERQVAALLRFARREELVLATTDLGELLRETADRFHARLEDARVSCEVQAAPGVLGRVDPEQIRQVLVNLVENALDALADDGAAQRTIRLSLRASAGVTTLEVADSGPGIPADLLERVFEPFFSCKPHGTGLGLAIVKRIAEAHGGAVRARLRPSGGLAFDVDLPLWREQ